MRMTRSIYKLVSNQVNRLQSVVSYLCGGEVSDNKWPLVVFHVVGTVLTGGVGTFGNFSTVSILIINHKCYFLFKKKKLTKFPKWLYRTCRGWILEVSSGKWKSAKLEFQGFHMTWVYITVPHLSGVYMSSALWLGGEDVRKETLPLHMKLNIQEVCASVKAILILHRVRWPLLRSSVHAACPVYPARPAINTQWSNTNGTLMQEVRDGCGSEGGRKRWKKTGPGVQDSGLRVG